jgi:hypothetical protein
MTIRSWLLSIFGVVASSPNTKTSSDEEESTQSFGEQDVAATNPAEHELLERVRALGLSGPCDIQYSHERREKGKYLAVLPWPSPDDEINHGTFIELTGPKEGGAVSKTVDGICNATIEVAEKYGHEPIFTQPFMYAGGVLVMLFGLKQKTS